MVNELLEDISNSEIEVLAGHFAKQRGYPKALAQLVVADD